MSEKAKDSNSGGNTAVTPADGGTVLPPDAVGKPSIEIIHRDGLLWTPVRTKPRREKKVAEFCAAKKLTHYLPLRRSVKRYERRSYEFFPPMFPGYIFCLVDNVLYQELLLSHAVLFRVKMDDALELKLIDDLKNVQIFEHFACEGELVVKPELAEGIPVKIINGPLRGINGIVEKRKGKVLVSINIEILGQSASVLLDVGDIEIYE